MSIFREDILAGQVALVTGGGSGICKGITEALMRHGADAVIVSRTQSKLDAAAAELEASTGRACLPVAADVRDVDAVGAAFDAALARFGRVDVVVNGAAGNFLAPAAALSPKGFRTVLEIDTVGTVGDRPKPRVFGELGAGSSTVDPNRGREDQNGARSAGRSAGGSEPGMSASRFTSRASSSALISAR